MRAFWGTVVGKLAVLAVAIVVVGAIIGLVVNQQSSDDKKGPSAQIVGPVSIEVDVFSGRNDPRLPSTKRQPPNSRRYSAGLTRVSSLRATLVSVTAASS